MNDRPKRPFFKKLRQIICNSLTVGVSAGIMIGLLVAMFLGVMNSPEHAPWPDNPPPAWIQNATGWMQASAAIASALIAAITVIVIALTLRATQRMVKSANDTLDATKQMARDQKRIGDAQTRAWLLIDKCSVKGVNDSPYFFATLKNFGHSPASNIKIKATSTTEDHSVNPKKVKSISDDTSYKYITMGDERGIRSFSFSKEWPETTHREFSVEWSYFANIGDEKPVTENERFMMFRRGDSLSVLRIDEKNTAMDF